MFDIASQPFLFNTYELDQDNGNYSKPRRGRKIGGRRFHLGDEPGEVQK